MLVEICGLFFCNASYLVEKSFRDILIKFSKIFFTVLVLLEEHFQFFKFLETKLKLIIWKRIVNEFQDALQNVSNLIAIKAQNDFLIYNCSHPKT
jgi:hypothetical protein